MNEYGRYLEKKQQWNEKRFFAIDLQKDVDRLDAYLHPPILFNVVEWKTDVRGNPMCRLTYQEEAEHYLPPFRVATIIVSNRQLQKRVEAIIEARRSSDGVN